MATVCSNKMRELARLLIELRKCNNNDNFELMNALDPVMFNTVIECATKIGGYDPQSKSYRAPSLSAHIGTSLKQASDLLIRLILKQDSSIRCDDKEKKKRCQWTTEISSVAFKNLNENKWNKPIILPLTRDILKFKEYVTQIANKSVLALRENPNNVKEFKNLVDATLTLTILCNRKRIGDVQYTTYLQNFSSINQEECMNSLSTSEKNLTRHYKRVVTGGKDTNRWPRGDVVIRKFAKKANLEYPKEITSNKIRKQIATVMQILNLNREESEQFAHFMGHTEKTHNEFYKLPQDVYQTAKISKLLILMDKGGGEQYKGKSLNEIDIDPQLEYAESEEQEEEISTTVPVSTLR
ncbi:hypothetical protein BDFB_012198, partial [Asbolus verrucosus]